MKNLIVTIYIIIFVALSGVSTIESYYNDSLSLFVIECQVNILATTGLLLFLFGKFHRVWILFFCFLLIGETFLVFSDLSLSAKDILFICVVFAPAVYINYLVGSRKGGNG